MTPGERVALPGENNSDDKGTVEPQQQRRFLSTSTEIMTEITGSEAPVLESSYTEQAEKDGRLSATPAEPLHKPAMQFKKNPVPDRVSTGIIFVGGGGGEYGTFT